MALSPYLATSALLLLLVLAAPASVQAGSSVAPESDVQPSPGCSSPSLRAAYQALESGHLEEAVLSLASCTDLTTTGAAPAAPAPVETLLESLILLSELEAALGPEAEAARARLRQAHELSLSHFGPYDWHTTDLARRLEAVGASAPTNPNRQRSARSNLEQLYLAPPLLEQSIPDAARPALLGQLVFLGELHAVSQAPWTAERYLQRARTLALRWEQPHSSHLSRALAGLSTAAEAQERFADAVALRDEQVALLRQQQNPLSSEALEALELQAALLERLGQPDLAEPLYRECLAVALEVYGTQDPGEMWMAFERLQADRLAGKPATLPPGGIQFPGRELQRAGLLFNVATFYLNLQQPEQALQLADEAFALHKKWHRPFQNSSAPYPGPQQSRLPADGRSFSPSYTQALAQRAAVYLGAGRFAEAERLLQEALELSDGPILDDQKGTLRANLASLYRLQERGGDAEALLLELLEHATHTHGAASPEAVDVHESLGALYLAWGDLQKARRSLELVWKNTAPHRPEEHPLQLSLHSMLASLYDALDQPVEALEHARRALELTRRRTFRQRPALSRAERLKLKPALSSARSEWLALTIGLERRGLLTAEQSWEGVLDWKGDRLLEALALRQARHPAELAPLVERYWRVSARLAQRRLEDPALPQPPESTEPVESKGLSLETERALLEKELMASLPVQRQLQSWRSTSAREVRSRLNERTALLDYYLYDRYGPPAPGRGFRSLERHLCVFVIRSSGVERLELGPYEPLLQSLKTWRATLVHPGEGSEQEAAVRVSQRLWHPIEPLLHGLDEVQVIPDGALGTLPFGALTATVSRQRLQERLLFSSRVVALPLALLLEPPSSTPGLLLVGEIPLTAMTSIPGRATDALGLQTLTQDRAELAAVEQAFLRAHPRGEVTRLTGPRATERALGAAVSGQQFLHLTTHGLDRPAFLEAQLAKASRPASVDDLQAGIAYEEDFELLGALVLAGADGPARGREDGILTAREIATLPLEDAALITLSACLTGTGADLQGEGVLGMQRAFLEAGAGAVLWTLWEVDDRATRLLMTRFYQLLFRDRLSPELALRSAQRWLRLEGARWLDPEWQGWKGWLRTLRGQAVPELAPYFWAGFELGRR